MPKKNLLIFLAVTCLIIIGTVIFDITYSAKNPNLSSSIDQTHSAVAIDMDLDENLVNTNDILTGQDPILVVIGTDNNAQPTTIRVIRNFGELKALNIHTSNTINQFDAVYKTLALAYLPKQRTLKQLFSSPKIFFSKPETKIHIVPLRTAGIRGILFDEDWNWVKEKDVEHPNFKETVIFALMADNSKRPIAELALPFSIIRDMQDPTKIELMH